MKILMPVSDWEEKIISRGRTAGGTIKTRWIIACDNWNWIVATQSANEDGPLSNISYYGNFRTLIPCLGPITTIDTNKIIPKIVATLKRSLNKDMSNVKLPPLNTGGRDMGAWIDETFDVSHMKEPVPTVYKRVFKTTEEDDDQ